MDIDAFILVGGRSSRYGSDKANVSVKGKPLLERTVETIKTALDPKRITLVGANGTQILGSAGMLLSLPFIFDVYQGRGPIGAIHAALASARTEWAFILACDYPFVSSELIERLATNISDEVDAIAPVQPDGRIQPLIAFFRVKPVLKLVEEPLIENRSAPPVRSIFECVRTRFVGFDEVRHLKGSRDFFLNLNTPADLERANAIIINSTKVTTRGT